MNTGLVAYTFKRLVPEQTYERTQNLDNILHVLFFESLNRWDVLKPKLSKRTDAYGHSGNSQYVHKILTVFARALSQLLWRKDLLARKTLQLRNLLLCEANNGARSFRNERATMELALKFVVSVCEDQLHERFFTLMFDFTEEARSMVFDVLLAFKRLPVATDRHVLNVEYNEFLWMQSRVGIILSKMDNLGLQNKLCDSLAILPSGRLDTNVEVSSSLTGLTMLQQQELFNHYDDLLKLILDLLLPRIQTPGDDKLTLMRQLTFSGDRKSKLRYHDDCISINGVYIPWLVSEFLVRFLSIYRPVQCAISSSCQVDEDTRSLLASRVLVNLSGVYDSLPRGDAVVHVQSEEGYDNSMYFLGKTVFHSSFEHCSILQFTERGSDLVNEDSSYESTSDRSGRSSVDKTSLGLQGKKVYYVDEADLQDGNEPSHAGELDLGRSKSISAVEVVSEGGVVGDSITENSSKRSTEDKEEGLNAADDDDYDYDDTEQNAENGPRTERNNGNGEKDAEDGESTAQEDDDEGEESDTTKEMSRALEAGYDPETTIPIRRPLLFTEKLEVVFDEQDIELVRDYLDSCRR